VTPVDLSLLLERTSWVNKLGEQSFPTESNIGRFAKTLAIFYFFLGVRRLKKSAAERRYFFKPKTTAKGLTL
jgi:hypothetical protein